MARQKTVDKSAPTSFKPWQKDAISIAFLYVLVVWLFSGAVFQNKVVQSGADIVHGAAIERAAEQLYQKEGSAILWFPYMFSGMPAFASGMYANDEHIPAMRYLKYVSPSYYFHALANFIFGNKPHSWEVSTFFLAGLFMFMLARQLGFGQLTSLAAAIGFMFCNFSVMSMAAGHGGKVITISRLPLVFWAVVRLTQSRSWVNGLIAAYVFGVFFFEAGHTQIIYYGLLALGIWYLFFCWEQRKDKPSIVKTTALLIAAVGLALCVGSLQFFSQYVYSDVTMRSVPPAIAEAGEVASGGMTFDYITNWSFHPVESLTFFIPTWFGLDSPYYWGWMTFTSSAFYFGLLTIAAAIIGVWKRRTWMTRAFAVIALFSLLVSFGRFFEPFFKLILAVLPFFDKFRVPSMILSLFGFCISVLACYGLDYMFNPNEQEKKGLEKKLLYAMAVLGGILIVGVLFKASFYDLFSMQGEQEAARYSAGQIARLKQVRTELLSSGFLKFIFLGELLLAMWYLSIRRMITPTIALAVLVVALAWDVISLNKKTLKFSSPSATHVDFPETSAIRFLKSDSSQFRIFPIGEHAQSGRPEWIYHQLETIGGYSPTKMRIYQDIIDFALYRGTDPNFPINLRVLNMLNVKYVMANGLVPDSVGWELVHADQESKSIVYRNPDALPRAFFVREALTVTDAAQRFAILQSPGFDPGQTALVESPLKVESPDSSSVRITSHRSNAMSLDVYCDKTALLVISEIYYPHGWTARLDGQEIPIHKTNHILRSVVVPPGAHTLEFHFEPGEFTAGVWLSSAGGYITSAGLWLAVALVIIRKRRA
jgi:hypothetical protein